jgi:hypothetical protein
VGYFPAELLDQPELRQSRRLLQRWVDRLLFPLTAPSGKGYIGRSLWRWQMGMDEDVHKALLEEQEERRWIKTNPAGWFCPSPLQLASRIVLVEGPFDRLALLAGGFEPQEVVALAGTTAQPSWFPDQVHSILLALDNDSGGREASRRLADAFARTGRAVLCCPPPQDAGGKDWNQRWQKLGPEGIRPLYEAVTGGDSHPQDLQKSRPGTAQ